MNTNIVILSGRLARDPELRYTQTGKAVTNFTLAVNRTKDEADFIPIVVWEAPAENVAKFLIKGSQVIITGRLTVESYEDKNKEKRYITKVTANRVEFTDNKKSHPPDTTPIPIGPDTNSVPF